MKAIEEMSTNEIKDHVDELKSIITKHYTKTIIQQSQIEQLQKENEKERKGRERLRNIYAEKLTENLGLKERIEEAFKLVENIDGRHLSFDDVRSDLLELLNKQN